jgi:hypothetical protein
MRKERSTLVRPCAFRGTPQVLRLALLVLAAGAATLPILPIPPLRAAEADLILRGGKVVTVFLDGRTQVLPLRAGDEARVRSAVEAYERAWRIINELTACELSDLRREKRERQRARKKRVK